MYAGTVIYVCSGVVNVLVYTATREGIIPWRQLFKRQRKPAQTNPISTKSDDVPDSYYSNSDTDLVSQPTQLVAIYPSIEKLNAERAAHWTKV